MQLHPRLGAPRETTRSGIERDIKVSVQRDEVQFIERHIHDAREQAFDEHAAADELAHQAADCFVVAERDQRTEILIAEIFQRAAVDACFDGFHHMAGLLVCRLRAGGDGGGFVGGGFFRPRAGGAIAEGKNIFVACCG